MIKHVVLFKFKPTTTGEEKRTLVSRLERLADLIEGVAQLKVRQDILHLEDSFDLGVFVTLTDQASLQQYGESQERLAVSAWARSLCDQVVLFDYEVGRE